MLLMTRLLRSTAVKVRLTRSVPSFTVSSLVGISSSFGCCGLASGFGFCSLVARGGAGFGFCAATVTASTAIIAINATTIRVKDIVSGSLGGDALRARRFLVLGFWFLVLIA